MATAKLYTYAEIAAALGVSSVSIRMKMNRGLLPEPDYRVGQSPAWKARRIEPWIEARKAEMAAAAIAADSPKDQS